jgi:acyl-CoA reductase-like NAD-dependent aldehyde dehydrogenase
VAISNPKEGPKAVVRGKKISGIGYHVEATVLVDVKSTMKVVREEIFVPWLRQFLSAT